MTIETAIAFALAGAILLARQVLDPAVAWDLRSSRIRLGIALAFLAFGLGSCSRYAEADEGDVVLWQARSCVGEAGWDDYEACRAMTHVHRKRAAEHGVSVEWMVRRYSAAVRQPPPNRRWILGLHPRGTAPVGWPQGPSWARHRVRLRKLVDVVEAALRPGAEDPCPDVIHYGGPMDRPHPALERDETCAPESRQLFYRMRNEDGAS